MAVLHDGSETERRIALWTALANLYLDTEMQSFTHEMIARRIIEQGYSLEQARCIDREEVFPVLYGNLLSVAGVWSGFADDWLIDKIAGENTKRGPLGRQWNRLLYACLGALLTEDWQAIAAAYARLSSSATATSGPPHG